mmetsp:Transcript_3095/g.7180  ORF Transcript_3095/g.7180 Transcript_3095/m.7180 type:complete len:807 (+) Transcript_3095:702-3122(+)
MADPVYQGSVYRVVVNKQTPEGWRLDDVKWYLDAACTEEILPTVEYMSNSERAEEFGRRKTLTKPPYKAPCDDTAAFDACGCRTPYAGFNITLEKCQIGNTTDDRDEYYCADEKYYEVGTYTHGCPPGKTSYEAWFATWNTNVACLKMRQSVSPAYRADEVLLQRWDGERFQHVVANTTVIPIRSGEAETVIPFAAGCGNKFVLPDNTQVDVQLVLNTDKLTANLGLDSNGKRAILFTAPAPAGTNIQLHCASNVDSTVLSVSCREGKWEELQSSSRGCAVPHSIPGGFVGEQVKQDYTPPGDTSGSDILGIMGIISGCVFSLFLGTLFWRAFFRSGAANLDAELRGAASPDSESGLTGGHHMGHYDPMLGSRPALMPGASGGKEFGKFGWDDFNTVPPRKTKSRDGQRQKQSNVNVSTTLNMVEEEMNRSTIGRTRRSDASSRSQSPAKRSHSSASKSDRLRARSIDEASLNGEGEGSVLSMSPPRKLRQRLNTAGSGAEGGLDASDPMNEDRVPVHRGTYSYRNGGSSSSSRYFAPGPGNRTHANLAPPAKSNAASRRGSARGGQDVEKSRTQQLLESWAGADPTRPSSAALKALRAKTDKILTGSKPAGTSFMEKTAEVLMRKSPERGSAASNLSREIKKDRDRSLSAAVERPVAGSGSYRNAKSASGGGPGRQFQQFPSGEPAFGASSSSSSGGGLHAGLGSAGGARSVSKGASSAASGQAGSGSFRPGFTQPNEAGGVVKGQPVNDYYRMKSERAGSASYRHSAGRSQSPAGNAPPAGSLDRFGNLAPPKGRIPNRDAFNR